MLVQIPEILSADEVARVRGRLRAEDFVDGRRTAAGATREVKSNLELRRSDDVFAEPVALVRKALSRSGIFGAAAAPKTMSTPIFNLYQTGMRYGDHVDNAIMGPEESRFRVDLSFTLFLSGQDEYDGGELVIKTGYGRHVVKLPAGHLALYPTYFYHEVVPVTRGARWACVGWLQSMVRDPIKRELLFDLAVLAQTMTQRGAGAVELELLEKVRKNLLRQWAET
jgi:PKHD-type hydroxylase